MSPSRPSPSYRHDITAELLAQKVVGIIRTVDDGSARYAAEAMRDGGLRTIEVTLTTPGAMSLIRELTARGDGLLVGAGTVLDEASVAEAVRAGARFVVSPNLDLRVLRTAHRYGVPALAGTGTVTEVLTALEYGADAIKVFPASALGPGWVKDVGAAVPQAPLVPTGGLKLTEVPAWLEAGAAACGLGSSLTAGEPRRAAERIALLLKDIAGA